LRGLTEEGDAVVGFVDGALVGGFDGEFEGRKDGFFDGSFDGSFVGDLDGENVGFEDGLFVIERVGTAESINMHVMPVNMANDRNMKKNLFIW
jgi:hypothetical protein